jgi:hypothetical protein
VLRGRYDARIPQFDELEGEVDGLDRPWKIVVCSRWARNCWKFAMVALKL